jgi:hypothetical protein
VTFPLYTSHFLLFSKSRRAWPPTRRQTFSSCLHFIFLGHQDPCSQFVSLLFRNPRECAGELLRCNIVDDQVFVENWSTERTSCAMVLFKELCSISPISTYCKHRVIQCAVLASVCREYSMLCALLILLPPLSFLHYR